MWIYHVDATPPPLKKRKAAPLFPDGTACKRLKPLAPGGFPLESLFLGMFLLEDFDAAALLLWPFYSADPASQPDGTLPPTPHPTLSDV